MTKSQQLLQRLTVSFLLLATFIMRPTVLGEVFDKFAVGFALLALTTHFVYLSLQHRKLTISRQNLFLWVGIVALWGFMAVLSVVAGSGGATIAFTLLMTMSVLIFCFGSILTDQSTNIMFFRGFVILCLVFVSTGLVTLALSVAMPIAKITYYTFTAGPYTDIVVVPYTFMTGSVASNDFQTQRCLVFFREPGISQMFLAWAFFNLESYKFKGWWVKVLLVAGTFSTLSTTGLIVFGVGYLGYLLAVRKYVSAFVLAVLGVASALFMPYFGVLAKQSTNVDSVGIRSAGMLGSIAAFYKHPFGTGLYSASGTIGSSINLIASLYQYGFIGLTLFGLVFVIPYWYNRSRRYVVVITMVLITMLFSESIMDAPLIFIILMARYDDYREFVPAAVRSFSRKMPHYVRSGRQF